MTTIVNLLEEKEIKVIQKSSVGTAINSINKNLSEELFTFLINNQLNRYLFNVFIRMGSFEIENWPFNLEFFIPHKIKEKVKESFIKKFSCSNCGQILLNEVSANLEKLDKNNEIECPKCKIFYNYDYDSLEDSFDISRRNIFEYLEQLASRNIIKRRFVKHCTFCRERKITEDFSKDNLRCSKCNNLCNISKDYYFEDDFLMNCLKKRGGEWFEWYVYNLCSYMHEEVEHNLIIEFEVDGIKKQREIDIIGRDGSDLIIYECKDTRKKSDLKDFGNIFDLALKFDDIKIVNSYDSNREIVRKLSELTGKKISSIKGSDLEDSFIGNEAIIVRLKSEEWPYGNHGINLFKQASPIKKREILQKILSELEKEDLENNLKALLKIFNNDAKIGDALTSSERKKIFEIFLELLNNPEKYLRNLKDGSILIEYLTSTIKYFGKELFEVKIEVKDLFLANLDYLDEKYKNTLNPATFQYYLVLFDKFEDEIMKLEKEKILEFYQLFLPVLKKYPSWRSRDKTLTILKKIIPLLNQNQLEETLNEIGTVVSTFSWSVNWEISEILKMIYPRVNETQKKAILSILNNIVENIDEQSSQKYAKEAVEYLIKL